VPRVKKVWAFDPTPVTGFTRLSGEVTGINKEKLEIDRIYERREILAILRSITSFFHLPPAEVSLPGTDRTPEVIQMLE